MADKRGNPFAAARDLLDRRIAAGREADERAREHYRAGEPPADPVEQVRYREFAAEEQRAAERERETARIEAENTARAGMDRSAAEGRRRDGGVISDEMLAARDTVGAGTMSQADYEAACARGHAELDELFAGNRRQQDAARSLADRQAAEREAEAE